MSTKDKAIELKKQYPCWTQTKIAGELGVSRERIRQVLTPLGIHKRYKQKRFCIVCGIQTGNKLYCSRDCYVKHHRVKVVCHYCGQLTGKRQNDVISYNGHSKKFFFCDKHCQGKWLGTNYCVRPRPRKYDYDAIMKLYSQGITRRDIAEKLNYPYTSVSSIIYNINHKLTETTSS